MGVPKSGHSARPTYFLTNTIPFYKIGTFGGEPDAFITRELYEEYKERFQYPKIGDILISASGTIGRTVEYTGEDAYFQDSNIVWFKHDERMDNSFLKCVYSIVKWSGIEGSTNHGHRLNHQLCWWPG